MIREIQLTWLILILGAVLSLAADRPMISSNESGQLVHTLADNGDQVPDFSYCGFEACNVPIPSVQAAVVVEPSGADDTQAIQSALDHMAQAALDNQASIGQAWRGAVVLAPGTFQISNSLYLHGDHIVLRGSQVDSQCLTEIRIIGKSRRPAIVVGSDSFDERRPKTTVDAHKPLRSSDIVDYAAIGTTRLNLSHVDGFEVGQTLTIVHPSTQQWIEAVGMNTFPDDDGKGSWLNWKADTMDQTWTRKIIAIDGRSVDLDAPITSSIDPQLTLGRVVVTPDPLHHHLGIENLRLVSDADTSFNPHDEEHAWDGVRFCGISDAWARNLTFQQFAGSAVYVGHDCRRVTVSDCHASNPISEQAGWRRHTFFCMGQQTLFLRCTTEHGRHDFSTGPLTSGPNAFVYCSAKNATQFSGPIGSWTTGVLYDNLQVDGHGIQLTNRETELAGSGWVAANSVLWNCVAPQIVCRRPPTAFNIATGIWGEVVGDGTWRSLNEFVSPASLFAAQLSARLGKSHSEQIVSLPALETIFSSAAELSSVPRFELANVAHSSVVEPNRNCNLAVTNGWLTMGDQLAIGSRHSLSWWRGSLIPARATEFGAGLTRYVPGLDGTLFTNSVGDLVTQMTSRGAIALEHHWGLWYDRRRDDHQMIRRMDAEVWPPFYEQPWARSGRGQAWDGLSKYDLSRFNHWYFDRLTQFATAADEHGLILMQQMYFQHNVLEAGAHWADFPWRPANCLQDVGFTEPPIYENRKRVFMAEAFYDVSHPVRRDLHTRYIRHCLDTLGRFDNVVFVLGEEYSGPTHFVRFWLDTVGQWSREHDRDVLVMLSACRDVQEQILAAKEYSRLIDIVDVKYWWYTTEGGLYDPPGGQNLAPRQQIRAWSGPKSRSIESTCQSIRDLKARFPEKAVVCSLPTKSPWMLLAAGCSLPELPKDADQNLLRDLVHLRPETSLPEWSLVSAGADEANVRKMSVSPKAVPMDATLVSEAKVVNPQTGKLRLISELSTQDYQDHSDTNPYVLWLDGAN